MDVASVVSLVIAALALVISTVGILYARRSAVSAKQAAEAADRSAAAAESELGIERRRRHEERRPKLSGKVSSPDGGDSYKLMVMLDDGSCRLTALEVAIRPGQGVSFKRGLSGAASLAGSPGILLLAFAYDEANEPTGVQPGETVSWWVKLAEEHGDRIQVDATCHAEGKGEGEDQWTVTIEAPVEPRLLDTIR
jgi:hypothetical protein